MAQKVDKAHYQILHDVSHCNNASKRSHDYSGQKILLYTQYTKWINQSISFQLNTSKYWSIVSVWTSKQSVSLYNVLYNVQIFMFSQYIQIYNTRCLCPSNKRRSRNHNQVSVLGPSTMCPLNFALAMTKQGTRDRLAGPTTHWGGYIFLTCSGDRERQSERPCIKSSQSENKMTIVLNYY